MAYKAVRRWSCGVASAFSAPILSVWRYYLQRASYDDKGLIMDKQLSAAKQELSAPAPKPAAGMKK
ncbi:MAG: hypothetical protein J6O40_00035 [Ruminococcus sp.]|nr:hypothetical protein [Ruminococcus sp.]